MSPRQPSPKTRIINRGRGHSYLLDGTKADGVTTVIGNGLPKPALINWAARVTAEAAVQQQDVWQDLAKKSERAAIEWLIQQRWATTDAAANRGTQVHGFAEQVTTGETVDVPDELVGHVDAYLDFLHDWQPADVLTEVVVINRKYRYMGRLDLLATLAGERWLLDIKTSGSGIYPDTALQLAAYRFAESYIDPDDPTVEHPMPQVDRAGVIWVRADGYDLHPYKAGEAEFRTFLYTQQVADFLARDRSDVIGDALYPEAG